MEEESSSSMGPKPIPDSEVQFQVKHGRVKFDLAADIIDYEDYQRRLEFQQSMRPSSGGSTMLMKAAKVQDQDQDRHGQHPKSKFSDGAIRHCPDKRVGTFALPGVGIGIGEGTVEKARVAAEMKSKDKVKQDDAVADLGKKLEALSFLKTIGGSRKDYGRLTSDEKDAALERFRTLKDHLDGLAEVDEETGEDKLIDIWDEDVLADATAHLREDDGSFKEMDGFERKAATTSYIARAAMDLGQ